MSTVTRGAIT